MFGLGTRCTGRGHARTFSPTNLKLRAEANDPADIVKYSQETFDALDLNTGLQVSFNINRRLNLIQYHPGFSKLADLYSRYDRTIRPATPLDRKPRDGERFIFTMDRLPQFYPELFETVTSLFALLEEAMDTPVDLEFVFQPEDRQFYLVQARPLSSYEEYRPVRIPKGIAKEHILLRGDTMLTNGKLKRVPNLVYVNPHKYYETEDKYAIARAIGEINEELADTGYILVGPGRWGSSSPLHGVPVRYSEITNAKLIVELGVTKENFTPELSYGTHFFAGLATDNTLYLPVFDNRPTNIFNEDWFEVNRASVRKTANPAITVYDGKFSAYLDGENGVGVVIVD